ncbi:FadR/GntR family transcriptional regulator [Vallicoccus soli]|uniref:FadR family transcriptional regulator n=1 Tax=Vallicoccus soli TaxID=2339232 RepID=A0A3A3Z3N1_9ACTN|nr:FCD domain-containing protein [Vallicoccus soli]RJK97563.1 FadR family transcriptional regulator [Vallicoccus soli]
MTLSSDGGWRPLGGSLNGRIREEILRFVEAGGLSPGERLPPERELALLLRVSRPSLREALRALQAEGHLVVRHGQGVFVAEPVAQRALRSSLADLDHDLGELFAMREVLEVPAARWAAERGDEVALGRVREAYERLDAALAAAEPDVAEVQALDALFHLRIVQAAGNGLLVQTQGVVDDLLRTGMRTTLAVPGRARRSHEEHRRVLAALLAGDGPAAARAARAHVRSTRAAAERRLRELAARDAAAAR